MPALLFTCFMTFGEDSGDSGERCSLSKGARRGGLGRGRSSGTGMALGVVSYPGKGPHLCFAVIGFELP